MFENYGKPLKIVRKFEFDDHDLDLFFVAYGNSLLTL